MFVGPSRYAAGVLAERSTPGSGLHLLDDGFQHRKLARDVDIAVLHRNDFSERLLPDGRLREGFASLRRAHILVLREEDAELEATVRERGLRQPIWWMERRMEVPAAQSGGGVLRDCTAGGILFRRAKACGVQLAAMRAWRDHHRYMEADMAELVELRRQHEAEAFLTTEKDRVRLAPGAMRVLEGTAPVQPVRLMVRLRQEAAAMEQLRTLLATAGDGPGGCGAAPGA